MHIRNQPYNLQTSLYYGIWYVFLFKSLTQGKFSQKQQHYFLLFWGVKKHHYFFSFWHVKYIEFPSMGISQINITHVMFFLRWPRGCSTVEWHPSSRVERFQPRWPFSDEGNPVYVHEHWCFRTTFLKIWHSRARMSKAKSKI